MLAIGMSICLVVIWLVVYITNIDRNINVGKVIAV